MKKQEAAKRHFRRRRKGTANSAPQLRGRRWFDDANELLETRRVCTHVVVGGRVTTARRALRGLAVPRPPST